MRQNYVSIRSRNGNLFVQWYSTGSYVRVLSSSLYGSSQKVSCGQTVSYERELYAMLLKIWNRSESETCDTSSITTYLYGRILSHYSSSSSNGNNLHIDPSLYSVLPPLNYVQQVVDKTVHWASQKRGWLEVLSSCPKSRWTGDTLTQPITFSSYNVITCCMSSSKTSTVWVFAASNKIFCTWTRRSAFDTWKWSIPLLLFDV